jgi:hypothetical protein
VIEDEDDGDGISAGLLWALVFVVCGAIVFVVSVAG